MRNEAAGFLLIAAMLLAGCEGKGSREGGDSGGLSNGAPSIVVPGPRVTLPGEAIVFAGIDALSVFDPDAGTSPVQVALVATHGSVTLSRTAGLTFSTGDGTGDAAATFTGSLAAINAALVGSSFTPEPNYVGAAEVRIVADDLGNSGAGGPMTDSASVSISVEAPSFDSGAGFDSDVAAVLPANDGSGGVYVVGWFATYRGEPGPRIVRINKDGSRDASFDAGTGFDIAPSALALAEDGSDDLYVGGPFNTYQGVSARGIVRLNSDGSRDAGFVVGTGFDFPSVSAIATATDGSGDVYVGGQFRSYQGSAAGRLIRLNPDGSRDTTFTVGAGFSTGTFDGAHSIALAVDGSGDVFVGGRFSTYQGAPAHGIVRLNTDGSRDASFVDPTDVTGYVRTVAALRDGSGDLLLGGDFGSYLGATGKIVRVNADGTRDASFDAGVGFSGWVYEIAAAADGDVYVGGTFLSYQGVETDRIVRLNADGSRDSDFEIGTGFNSTVYAVALASDGAVYVGGSFSTYKGKPAPRIARLTPSGDPD